MKHFSGIRSIFLNHVIIFEPNNLTVLSIWPPFLLMVWTVFSKAAGRAGINIVERHVVTVSLPAELGLRLFRQLDVWSLRKVTRKYVPIPIKWCRHLRERQMCLELFLPSRVLFCGCLWMGKMYAAATLFVLMCLAAATHADHHHPCRKSSSSYIFWNIRC